MKQLLDCLETSDAVDTSQSRVSPGCATESTGVSLINDLLLAEGNGQLSILRHLKAIFDSLEIEALLTHLWSLGRGG